MSFPFFITLKYPIYSAIEGGNDLEIKTLKFNAIRGKHLLSKFLPNLKAILQIEKNLHFISDCQETFNELKAKEEELTIFSGILEKVYNEIKQRSIQDLSTSEEVLNTTLINMFFPSVRERDPLSCLVEAEGSGLFLTIQEFEQMHFEDIIQILSELKKKSSVVIQSYLL